MRGLLLLILGGLLLATRGQSRAQPNGAIGVDPIAQGFKNVPPEARLRMFWRIFGPAWERTEIDYQLDELHKAGVGGVMTCFTYPVSVDDPAQGIHNDRFLSSTFLDTLHYAAAAAHKRDISFGICGGTGWPFGGPTVSLHDAAQRIRMMAISATGDCYPLPKLRAEERIVAAFAGVKEVTDRITGDRIPAQLPADSLLVFIAGPTGMQVKRAALGGEGYVVDHLSREATQRYLDSVITPLAGSTPSTPIDSLFCDSLEVYRTNWTHDFPAQFRKRRGYDLIPHLPELFAQPGQPTTPKLRFDFWRTVAELAEEEFAATVHRWCREHHVAFVLEAYGTPSMGFTAARYCDVPWGEQYEWKGFSFSRFAASGGHLAGKKIIGAEAWTWTGLPNRLADSLQDLKLCSDLHFLAGENELTGVDFPYSPRSVPAPGWTPYYGPVINWNNPQWPYFPYLAAYINRCQWLLRQGRPVADVALYTPTEDAFAQASMEQLLLDFQLRDRFATGELTDEFGLKKAFKHHSNSISAILESGYNYDGIDFFAVNKLAHVESGQLVAGDGRYRIVVVPPLAAIHRKAFLTLCRLARSGGTVIFIAHLPQSAYDDVGRAPDTALIHSLERQMQSNPAADEKPGAEVRRYALGKGMILVAANDDGALRAALAAVEIPGAQQGPDVKLFSIAPAGGYAEANISHVHRSVGRRDFYFLANMGDREANFRARFRADGRAVSLWNPMTGAISARNATLRPNGDAQRSPEVVLNLPSHGSIFVCIGPQPMRQRMTPIQTATAQNERHLLPIHWKVAFNGPDAPPPYETDQLTSWTEWPGAKYFSGQATYTGSFTLDQPPPHSHVRFARVCEAGEVWINDRPAGAVWMPPYDVDASGLLRSGVNTIRITVGNLPVNRVLGLPDPDLAALHAVYGERFPAPEEKHLMSQPAPSGLIGDLLLVTETRQK
jgi:hypothetical protein